jgi:hypothetical protein
MGGYGYRLGCGSLGRTGAPRKSRVDAVCWRSTPSGLAAAPWTLAAARPERESSNKSRCHRIVT